MRTVIAIEAFEKNEPGEEGMGTFRE